MILLYLLPSGMYPEFPAMLTNLRIPRKFRRKIIDMMKFDQASVEVNRDSCMFVALACQHAHAYVMWLAACIGRPLGHFASRGLPLKNFYPSRDVLFPPFRPASSFPIFGFMGVLRSEWLFREVNGCLRDKWMP